MIRHESEVPNANEALRQHVHKESTDELVARDCHQTLFVAVSIIPPTERDIVAIEGNQSVIRDGDAVRVASEIPEDLLRSAECRLRINNPVLTKQRS